MLGRGITCAVTKNGSTVDVNRFSDYNKLINVAARVLNTVYYKSLLNLGDEPEAKDLNDIEKYWIKIVQIGIGK